MVISEQDIIGLSFYAGVGDPAHQVRPDLLHDLFGEDNGAVGIEEGVRVSRYPAVT